MLADILSVINDNKNIVVCLLWLRSRLVLPTVTRSYWWTKPEMIRLESGSVYFDLDRDTIDKVEHRPHNNELLIYCK